MKIFSLFFLLFVCAMSAQAQLNLTVDTTADNATLTACTTAANDCSLRGAIARANATIDNDSIGFALLAGINTITLTGGEIIIDSAATAGALTITNSTGASNLLISGNNTSRVFFVYPGANLTLSGVTVTKGFTTGGGGGINNQGTLSLLNSTVSGNTAQNNDGGGIININGTLSLTNSTVSGNTGQLGGGIDNSSGTTTLTNSTVSGNTATVGGGGIFNHSGGTLSLTNSTVSGNAANDGSGGGGGGGIFNSGTLNLTGVTVAYNSAAGYGAGGVSNTGTANLRNTIVAKNTAAVVSDFDGAIAPASSFNLIGNGGGMSGITGGTNGNQVGIDPKLDPTLALNGGTTLNHALLSGSPAIDQGTATGTDQRGLTRPSDNQSITNATGGNGADIGAFEVQNATTAASVSVSGRVITQSGRGIRNVVITMTDSMGNTRTATTTSFGYYRFEEVAAGETYIFAARGKRFSFGQNTQVHSITEDTSNINFIANDQSVLPSN